MENYLIQYNRVISHYHNLSEGDFVHWLLNLTNYLQ